MWIPVLCIFGGFILCAIGMVLLDMAFGPPVTTFLEVVLSGEVERWPVVLQVSPEIVKLKEAGDQHDFFASQHATSLPGSPGSN